MLCRVEKKVSISLASIDATRRSMRVMSRRLLRPEKTDTLENFDTPVMKANVMWRSLALITL